MFAVSLCRSQTGNEGLLHSRENLLSSSASPIICLSHFFSPTFSVCFSMIMLLENEASPPCGGFSISLEVKDTVSTLVQLGLTLEYFRCGPVAKHLHNSKRCVCFLFWVCVCVFMAPCSTPAFKPIINFDLLFILSFISPMYFKITFPLKSLK